jgi:hypothetical protein
VYQFRAVFVVCVVLAVAAMSAPAPACVGARALGMGGAFVAVADDTSATYWNPAALPYLPEKSATYMHVFNENINYQNYFAYVQTLDDKSAVGLSYLTYQLIPAISMYDSSISWGETWYWLSYGVEVAEGTALGVNLKFIEDNLEVVESGVELPISADTDMGLDVGVFSHVGDNVTLGLLIQNANEPDTQINGVTAATWGRNWRPGAAVKLEDGVTIATEVYDAFNDMDARGVRFGIEKKFAEERFALRAGRYAGGGISALTLGAGIWGEQGWTLDVAYLTGDLDNTWVASGTFAWE